MAEIVAVCMSAHKGEAKKAVAEAELRAAHGLVGDAHAGDWHRQVSLLAEEKIDEMRRLGLELEPGAFGENLIVRGADLSGLRIGDRLRVGEAELEVTQLGKECHDHCAIFQQVGRCIMPTDGIFTRVLAGGRVQAGDPVEIERLPG
ncbi:MAG: MOSC domain-containing protein [Deltaproteobacteria bacterium]|nr:MOSC domain-containing protein [Deltaproteobacteria bacterium]